MFLIHVVPIKRAIAKETLSYFSASNIPAGALVSVPVRQKLVKALVVRAEPAKDAKANLRSASFSVKKIEGVHAGQVLLPDFVKAAREAADYFAGTTGAALSALVPSVALEYTPADKKSTPPKSQQKENVRAPVYLSQAGDDERRSMYKSVIREEFARGMSVFFCVPESEEIERVQSALSRGIEGHTFILHAGLKKTELAKNYAAAARATHPVLIIATPSFLALPREDVRTIIVEKESSRAYHRPVRPFIDMRVFAEIFGRLSGSRVIFGDVVLRLETLHRRKDPWVQELGALSFRALSSAKSDLIDMRPYFDKTKRQKVSFLSEELVGKVGRVRESGGRLAIFAARRGRFPITLCGDCGATVVCTHCSAPLVLHRGGNRKSDNPVFLCHKCGTGLRAYDTCSACGSWRLTTLGAGTEEIAHALKEHAPDLSLFQIDADSTPTHKKARAVRDNFYKTPGAVLVGTEKAIAYLHEPVTHTAAVAIDSFFTIPDFRMNERVFSALLRLRSRATESFLIQTRNPDMPLFGHVLDGNVMDFYRAELKDRKAFGYPPFMTLIKLEVEGAKQAVTRETKRAMDKLKNYSPETYSAFTHTVREKHRANILIRLPEGAWVDQELLGILRSLPPTFSIHINPEHIL